MTNNEQLTERYIYAVVRDTPEVDRADIANELRSTIADTIDGHIAHGMNPEEAERQTLQGLGSPTVMAAKYTTGATSLLGSRYYFVWKRVLVNLLMWLVPLVAILVTVLEILEDGTQYTDIIASGLNAGLETAVHVTFWTTIVFVIIDRATAKDEAGEWNVSLLPTAPVSVTQGSGPSKSDAIASSIFSLVMGILLVLQSNSLWIRSSEPVPLLDTALWSFWLPWLIGACIVSAAFEYVKYRAGWTLNNVILATVISLAFSLPVMYLALNDRLLSPELIAAVPDLVPKLGFDAGVLDIVNLSIAVGALLVTIWEIAEALLGYRKVRLAQNYGDEYQYANS